MRRQRAGYIVWLLLSACLYFFENNTGTRILLISSILLPLLPSLRQALFAPDRREAEPRSARKKVSSSPEPEPEDTGSVRLYLPGDPVNRIHWKLSAGRDMLLVRETFLPRNEKREDQKLLPEERPLRRTRWPLSRLCVALMGGALLLLLLLPEARLSAQALANRIFRASEAVNAYVYASFPVAEDQSVLPAGILLSVFLLAWLTLTALSRSRVPLLLTQGACVLFQVYFGLSLPTWLQLGLFALFLCGMLQHPRSKRALALMLGGLALVSLVVFLLWPGPDAATEAASEAVRDRLSRAVQEITGRSTELPEGISEVRHVHTQSLSAGTGSARAEREFRLVTREEEQISMPHWVDYLKIIWMLLLTVAVIILPFLPFLALNARMKKAQAAREVFQSENISEAVCAILQHAVAWLEAVNCGGGNLPYRLWPDALVQSGLPEHYAKRFGQGALLYEEAAYSRHPLTGEQRQQALTLLEETEKLVKARANRRQRLRMKYKEFLWI